MPWIIQPGGASPSGEDQTKHLATPKYTEWEERWKVWAEERRAANKVDAESVFIEELYDGAPVQKPENLPRTIRWTKRGKLKDCVSFLGHLVLSTRARKMIEELEPGIHEFFEIKMEHMKTGEIWPEPFWLLHVRNKIDGIDEDHTHSQRSQFVFRADAIKDVHLWKDSRNQFRRDTFASDHFVSELEKRGIEGIGVNRQYYSVSDNKGQFLKRATKWVAFLLFVISIVAFAAEYYMTRGSVYASAGELPSSCIAFSDGLNSCQRRGDGFMCTLRGTLGPTPPPKYVCTRYSYFEMLTPRFE